MFFVNNVIYILKYTFFVNDVIYILKDTFFVLTFFAYVNFIYL